MAHAREEERAGAAGEDTNRRGGPGAQGAAQVAKPAARAIVGASNRPPSGHPGVPLTAEQAFRLSSARLWFRMAPHVSSPPSPTLTAPSPSARPTDADPELLALPAPPRGERTATVVLMLLTALAALWMAFALLGEARYALTAGQPIDVGEVAGLAPGPDLANRYVRATGLLGTGGAIRYGRPAEGDSFRLAPVAGNPKLWVEIRVPEGFEGPRFVPPTSFAGRLVPFADAGVRHAGLRAVVQERTQVAVPPDAWILIDGNSPRASRWAVALAALFAGFALWNVAGVARVLAKVRDKNGRPESEPAAAA